MKKAQRSSTPAENGSLGNPKWRRCEVAGICLLLVIIVLLVFGQTVHHAFVNYDDQAYVYGNPIVSKGLSFEALCRAFTHVHAGNWHPLTTIFHMLDCQFYGLNPWGHHLTNLLLHAAVAVLLFLMLLEMTRALWRCSFVAALFAIHPLRMESVAWVAELKDVLSGFFFMLTLWTYARYARRLETGGASSRLYAMVVVWFALGLLSKPMLVTAPFVLLLLDYWPLGRLHNRSQIPRLLREKLPLFALSALSCTATVIAQKNAIQLMEHSPLSLRVENALIACLVYLGKLIYPVKLSVLYPISKNGSSEWQVIAAVMLLGGLTAWAILSRQKQPFLLVGWFWYLGMLVPVSGILQVGSQSYADRYTYLPQIGVCFAGTWIAADWAAEWRHGRPVVGVVAVMFLCAMMVVGYHQAYYWRDSQSLWTHALQCTKDNSVAHYNLGNALLAQGRRDEAMAHYRQALQINPAYAAAHRNLGNLLFQQGRADEAILHTQKALELQPADAAIQNNLAWMLATASEASVRDGTRAIELAKQAGLSSGGNDLLNLHILAAAYAEAGDFPNAVETAQYALQLAEAQSDAALVSMLHREIKLYQAGQPYREGR